MTVAKQSMNRHLRLIDSAEAVGDDEKLEKHLTLFNASVSRLVEREAALDAATPSSGAPEPVVEASTLVSREPLVPPPAPSRVNEFTVESTAHWTDEQLWAQAGELHFDPWAQDRVWDILDSRSARHEALTYGDGTAPEPEFPDEDEPQEHAAPELSDAEMFRAYLANGEAGTIEEQCREAYEQYNRSQYNRAVEECSGVMLNARGKERKVNSYSLFQGNLTTAKAYASEELQAWWRSNGRRSYAAFRYSFLGGQGNSRRAWERANREGFENVA